jgi:hypothetical protein
MSKLRTAVRMSLGGAVCGSFLGIFAGGLLGALCGSLVGDTSLGLEGALAGGCVGCLGGAICGAALAARDKSTRGGLRANTGDATGGHEVGARTCPLVIQDLRDASPDMEHRPM